MEIKEIPKILFNEFSQRFGVREEKKVSEFLIRELDIGGAVGFHQEMSSDKTFFILWPYLKEGDLYSGYLLQIAAGPKSKGVWAYGRGQLMQESLTADFPINGVDLNAPIVFILTMILARATALIQSPILPKEEFWEVQRYPDSDYKKP